MAQAATGQPTAAASTTLSLEPVVSQAKYCREYSGGISLRLEFILHYRNESNNSIVLPMFARLSRYELFTDAAALAKDAAEADLRFRVEDVIDARKLDPSRPDAKLFWTLRPGESASSYSSLSILVQPAHKEFSALLGRDHYLKLYMNPWPAERTTGKKLSTLWDRYGILWLTDIPSLPFKFHVEHQPRTDPCPLRVD